jgi:hypothetical protein
MHMLFAAASYGAGKQAEALFLPKGRGGGLSIP